MNRSKPGFTLIEFMIVHLDHLHPDCPALAGDPGNA